MDLGENASQRDNKPQEDMTFTEKNSSQESEYPLSISLGENTIAESKLR